ncbi:MAG TPA: class I SAM-dependent methyltransferase [Bacteroidia bacterium]|jgi:ubiquinone/menaquinone biosynthesis C-methylase UbiE|nr:class I SAM-dependent methyltransferase [Bacteroidia bacterium]
MASFSDYFSKQSGIYVKYRPTYPKELFSYLSSLTKEHNLAWDCGTGNGQSAIGLSEFYDSVIATDPSEEQIKNAIANGKVIYRVEKAEDNSLQSNSVDIITIANALHWFNFDAFYKEVRRVLKSNGIIAAWAYALPIISPEIDSIAKQFHDDTLGTCWLPPNRMVEKGYTTIPFPFEQIVIPSFRIEKTMNLQDLIGYFNTWSATQRFIQEKKFNPTEKLEKDIRKVWGNIELEKKLTWNLILKIGKVTQ